MAHRITLGVALGYLSKNFGKAMGSMNGILSFYECRWSGRYTQWW